MEKADTAKNKGIKFQPLPIRKEYGPVLRKVYYVLKDGRSHMMESFKGLEKDERGLIIDLISKMATVQNFKSFMIKNHLKHYTYGELRPKPHRFFFFQIHGKHIIFFGYVLKKKDSLKDEFYKALQKEKETYDREFEEFLSSGN